MDKMILKDLYNSPLSPNQPLKSADGLYIIILKNKIMSLENVGLN
jgi:hypothetical protein